MATGVLVHPLGHESHTLTEREYNDLKACLDIRRTPDEDLAKDVLTAMLPVFGNPQTVSTERILNCLINWMQQNWMQQNENDEDMTEGILFGKGLVRLYDDTEFERLKEYLAVIRAGGWLPEFLTRVCQQKRLTPLLLMQSMTDEIEEFEQQRKSAEQFYEQHPELLKELFWEGPKEEPSQPKEEPPAKAQRAHKPQKSAA